MNSSTPEDEYWMRRALAEARLGAAAGEVPVGAVLVRDGVELAAAFNQPIATHDPTAHAEVGALRKAAAELGNYRLVGSTLYVTIEPCTMCVGAMIHARVARLVYGAAEPRAGVVCSHLQLLDSNIYNHRITHAAGVLADECRALMTEFFHERRRHPAQE
ncbi:MAG: tRNA adenosine(34) deaminase TadA [Pseudohongiellaceae bacterium]|jgi:tRNA(adenine34) deaminase